MTNKEIAYRQIAGLVEKFLSQIESYENDGYNETQTRRDFIDPFFKAFGWDIDNEQGYSEVYREVVHEARAPIEGAVKSPDYAFRIGGEKNVLFFVEAKKPSVHLFKAGEPAYQLRRYAWNSGLAVSILTNFKEFAVYDCLQPPDFYDDPRVARAEYLTYQNYVGTKTGLIDHDNRFDFLWETFGRQNIPRGGLDKYLQSDQFKKGFETVDQHFLSLLEDWRQKLAHVIYRYNKSITEKEINFVVQQIIDRLVFLRIAEERGIEPYGNVKKVTETSELDACYKKLFTLFERADEKYNSGLFDLANDNISDKITVKNNIIKEIVRDLYYPSPYDFSTIPVEILGSAYERFLGKVIRLTSNNVPNIEAKPEIRKAGGVYYTPHYIVDYIVQNTVGKLVDHKTPKEVAKIKIVDPACGSGSFLLGAYRFLLDWHRDYYQKHCKPSKGRKTDPLTPDGQLTASEKKQILCNNIFGVDIDVNAVEITKLSLLLKCMEGETKTSIASTVRLFHEKVLPNIDGNIRNGNSLIDTDYYDKNFDTVDEDSIKPFNWQRAFPAAFDQGGFDAVIGNPPYRTLLLGKKQKSQNKNLLQYYQSHYPAAFEYKVNLFALFIERSINLLNTNGFHSFIVPNTFYYTPSFKQIRNLLLSNGNFDSVVNLRYKVFLQTELGGSGIFVFSKNRNKQISKIITVQDFKSFETPEIQKVTKNDFLTNENHNLIPEADTSAIISKIFHQNGIEKLGDVTKIYQGIITGNNKIYLSDKPKNSLWKPILKGKDINRYYALAPNTFIYYRPKELWSNTDEKMFRTNEKIISRQTSDKLIAAIDRNGYFSLDSTHVIHLRTNKICIEYLLGLFNSKLLSFLYQSNVQEKGRVFAQVKIVNLKPLPIKMINFETVEKEQYKQIVRLVTQLINLYTEKQKMLLPTRLNLIEDKIAYCEDKINEIVYQLYDLTEAEIKIIEGK
ncbi:MAG: N-6 DNA methylase [Planctomycetaceae bacterium]|jgi:type I restriction-modification system DNA methylase subunit|nr:N-6 DNA methylase [Planctomycetaceae bacterium]